MTMAGFSYRDPLYEQLARAAEAKHGLPQGILDAIRTRGERSNANQVSSAGARTVYQFIPSTRSGFMRKYGIDPWSGPEAATEAAAIHLRDDYKRTGSWDEAIARYHGGQRPGHRSRQYAQTVGDFDNGGQTMALGNSLYPPPYYGGRDPLAPLPNPELAPETIKETAPVVADAGMSVPVPAAAPSAVHKRGGILGALESVFMPDPNSLWAGALRDGIFNARESQQQYQAGQQKQAVDLATANAKLKQMMRNGEFQVVGNNVFHVKPDGSTEMIAAPQSKPEKLQLIELWKSMPDNDPAKDLVRRILEGSSSDEALTSRERAAQVRAGATTQAARIRATAPPRTSTTLPPLPPGNWTVVK